MVMILYCSACDLRFLSDEAVAKTLTPNGDASLTAICPKCNSFKLTVPETQALRLQDYPTGYFVVVGAQESSIFCRRKEGNIFRWVGPSETLAEADDIPSSTYIQPLAASALGIKPDERGS